MLARTKAARKRWRKRGTRPRTSASSHARTAASAAGTAHSVSQRRCGIVEQEAKRHEQPRPPEVVAGVDCDRVRRELGRRLDAPRCRVRVAVGEEQRVRRGLGAVPDRVRRRVAQPTRHPAAHEAGEPAEQGGDGGEAAQAAQAAVPTEAPRAADPPSVDDTRNAGTARSRRKPAPSRPWRRGRADLDVHRVRACSREARVGVGREGQVGGEVGRVADVGDEEAVQRRRRSALEQHGQPDDETERERGHAEQRHPARNAGGQGRAGRGRSRGDAGGRR